jgi:hypothetical protein
MRYNASIQHLISSFLLGRVKVPFFFALMVLGTSAAGQDSFQFKMELSTNDYFHGRKIRKKPRTFSEVKQYATIKIRYSPNDSVEAVVNINRAGYYVLEDEVRRTIPVTFRFDSDRPEDGSRLVQHYISPTLNDPFKLYYNKNGDLLNEHEIYARDPKKDFLFEMETGSSTSRLSSLMLYPKHNIAEALGTMIKIRSMEMLHVQDTVFLSGELQKTRIDTSYVQFVRRGFPFLQKVESDTLNFSLDFKPIKDEDKLVVKSRWGMDLELERKTENVTQFMINMQTDTIQMIWHTSQIQQLTLNPHLWPIRWKADQTFIITGEYNTKYITKRKLFFSVTAYTPLTSPAVGR